MDFYHIYNRGVEGRNIFEDKTDLNRFIYSLKAFNSLEPIGSIYQQNLKKNKNLGVRHLNNLVEVVVYCLNPNHFHLLIGSDDPTKLSEFLKRLAGGYTNYFNSRHHRSGGLFQGKTKRKLVLNNSQFQYTASYILGNANVHGLLGQYIGTNSFLTKHQDSFSFNTERFYKESCQLGKLINSGRKELQGIEIEGNNLGVRHLNKLYGKK